MMNAATLDIDQLANACGLRKSRAISGGVYLCSDEALRAFATAVAHQFNLSRSDTVASSSSNGTEGLSAYAQAQ